MNRVRGRRRNDGAREYNKSSWLDWTTDRDGSSMDANGAESVVWIYGRIKRVDDERIWKIKKRDNGERKKEESDGRGERESQALINQITYNGCWPREEGAVNWGRWRGYEKKKTRKKSEEVMRTRNERSSSRYPSESHWSRRTGRQLDHVSLNLTQAEWAKSKDV